MNPPVNLEVNEFTIILESFSRMVRVRVKEYRLL